MGPTSLKIQYSEFFRLNKSHFTVILVFSAIYLAWTQWIVGFRDDHLSFIIFIAAMFITHKLTRQIAYFFIFFILFWIIYDSMRIYPNYMFNDVHIALPYEIEKSLFGITYQNSILTPNEFFKSTASVPFDFLSGLFYLSWVPVPLGLGIYLFYTDRKMLLRFSAAYLFTNLLGFCIYYLFPAAPPWYFAKYGEAQLFNIPGDPAQLIRFDALIGHPLFENIYSKNANVFAAIPSLHAAYPVVTWYYARKKKLKFASILIFIDIIGIWFAAVYSFHHYFIDVLMGFGCAVLAILLFEKVLMKTSFSKYLDKYRVFAES